MSDLDIMKTINGEITMTLNDIMEKLPFLDYNEPLIYHIYASVNKLNDEETEQVRKTINKLKENQSCIKQHYLDTCKIEADFM